MSEVWAQWEGQVINGQFPLRRCLGVSDHSGVFLTEAPALNLPEAALKLVPLIPTLAETQLAHWNAAAALSHPHLVRLFGTGRCQLGALHCLYVLMEYAEQNLAHLLRNRALTDVEARDLLPPALDALAFLHSRNQVQGQLRPSNILVVGDQLKLASDTIRPAGEAATSISMLSVYDPPEGRDGSFSTAGDIWALGVTLYEALTRTTPEKPGERSHGVTLPPDFPPGSANIVKECLSRRPGDRPSVMNLLAWMRVRPRPEATPAAADTGVAAGLERAARVATQVPLPSGLDPLLVPVAAVAGDGVAPAASVRAASTQATSRSGAAAQTAASRPGSSHTAAQSSPGAAGAAAAAIEPGRLTIRAVVERAPPEEEPVGKRSFLPMAVGAVVVVVAGWFGVRHFSGGAEPRQPAANTSQSVPATADTGAGSADTMQKSPSTDQQPAVATSAPPAASAAPPPTASAVKRQSSQRAGHGSNSSATASNPASVVHEEIPNVSRSALATVHGRVKVTVRVTVDPSGKVVSDTLENAGPSRYFARVASEAARKWQFAPAPGNASRTWLVRFEFSHSGATGHVVGF